MAELDLPEGPYEIESLMREISRLLQAAASVTIAPPPPATPRVLTGITVHDLLQRLHCADETKHPTPRYSIRSHRPVLGPVVNLLKRVILWGVRPHLDEMNERQERHNESMLQLQHALIGAIDDMSRNQAALEGSRQIQNQTLAQIRDLFDKLMPLVKRLDKAANRHDLGAFLGSLDNETRLHLMEHTRGSESLIRERFAGYLELFRERPGPILDIGCGRGEFLQILGEAEIPARGCDPDPSMVEACRTSGLNVVQMNAEEALASIAPSSLGGIFCAQVIEHLYPADLLGFLTDSRKSLAPGGVIVIESLNPQSLGVLAHSYYKDLEHKQPVDPEYLCRLLEAAGFSNTRWLEKNHFTQEEKLAWPAYEELTGISREAHTALGEIVARLNRQIWGAQDYCVVAEVPPTEVA